jgi:DNA-binding MarR family transcriptional regulator
MTDGALAEELRQAIGHLVRAARAVDTLPPGESAVLGHLDRSGPLTTADLAARRGVTHQSAAKTVKSLLAAGLALTEPHPADRRKLLVHITPAGRARLTAERSRRTGTLDAAIAEALTPQEQRRLHECVTLINRLTAHLHHP